MGSYARFPETYELTHPALHGNYHYTSLRVECINYWPN